MILQPMPEEAACALAVEALAWMAKREDLFAVFMGASGLAVDDLRARSTEPEFLGFVLDFLLSREEDLLAFAAETGIKPDFPMRARAGLPGGAEPNWT